MVGLYDRALRGQSPDSANNLREIGSNLKHIIQSMETKV